MSRNKTVRKLLERLFGKICMLEASGIHSVPKEKRKKIKGYRASDEDLTYHHIKEKSNGGETTLQNGALLKSYNHQWLHSLPEEEKAKVNEAIIEFKASILTIEGNTITSSRGVSITLNEDYSEETIPVYDNTEDVLRKREKFNRARIKSETKKDIERGVIEYDEDR